MKVLFSYKSDSPKKYVIFYNTLCNEISEHILDLDEKNIQVIEPEVINLNVMILVYFIKNLFRIKKDASFLFFIFSVYQYSRLEYYNPSVVITFIDNSSVFQWVSKHYKRADFYAIQNGNRSKKELLNGFKNNLTTFFTFGCYEKIQYEKYGHFANSFISAGSFISAIYCKENEKIRVICDICLVSQHKLAIFNDINNSELKENLKLIDYNLSEYLNEYKEFSFQILCRHKKKSREGRFEQKYFQSIYGPQVKLCFQDDCEYSTYKGMSESRVIVSCYSTSASEALGWGKKVLFCDYSENNIFSDYETGIWLSTDSSYKNFSSKLTDIIYMNKSEYKSITEDYFRHVMSYDQEVSTIEKIKGCIFGDKGKYDKI